MLQIVPVIELVGMRGREIERGNQQTSAHGILPSHDPQRPQIIRRRVRSEANRLGSKFELRMSALGQKQTLAHVRVMSALPPKRTLGDWGGDVSFVPKADIPLSASVYAVRTFLLRTTTRPLR